MLEIKSSDHEALMLEDSPVLVAILRREAIHNANLNWKEDRRGENSLACHYRDAAAILCVRLWAKLPEPISWGDLVDEISCYLSGAVGMDDHESYDAGHLAFCFTAEQWDGFAHLARELCPVIAAREGREPLPDDPKRLAELSERQQPDGHVSVPEVRS